MIGMQGLALSNDTISVATGLKKSRTSPSRGTNLKNEQIDFTPDKDMWF